MFDIEEVRYLCYVIKDTFYLSGKSTYEYIMFGDIDQYEILVDFDIEDWIKKLNRVTYKKYKNGYLLNFFDEEFKVYVSRLKIHVDDYLKEAVFNLESIFIKISLDTPGFSTYHVSGREFHVSWLDPYDVRPITKLGYIEPVNYGLMESRGHLVFKMFELKVKHKLDMRSEVEKRLCKLNYQTITDAKDAFFNILKNDKSYYAIKSLDTIGVLEVAFPLIIKMKEENLWQFGLYCLKKLENILNTDHYFQDSLAKAIRRKMSYKLNDEITKYQMIKFSVLFHDAHKIMKLKINSPELYEEPFTDFCSYFKFEEALCRYYGQVIQSNRRLKVELKHSIEAIKESDEILYEFYEEYQDDVIDVLLVCYVDQLCHDLHNEEDMKEKISYVMMRYISKYLEIQSINSEITTMEIDSAGLSDVELTLLIENVKKNVFFGNLRYDRKSIIPYFQKLIEQS